MCHTLLEADLPDPARQVLDDQSLQTLFFEAEVALIERLITRHTLGSRATVQVQFFAKLYKEDGKLDTCVIHKWKMARGGFSSEDTITAADATASRRWDIL